MSEQWQQQTERGSTFATRILVWVTLLLGRRAILLLLYPIIAYYLLTARAPRRAAKAYWNRLGHPKPGWRRLFRHFYTFAVVAVDRFSFLTGRSHRFEIERHNEHLMHDLLSEGQGCLLMLAHVGSFDVMRALAPDDHEASIRLLMDRQHNARAIEVLNLLDPGMSQAIIDAASSPADLALTIKESVERGHMVGIMADRVRADEAAVDVELLGHSASMPQSPWLLAMVLKVPVMMCTGLYLGGNRYAVHFERLEIPQKVSRRQRPEAMTAMAQQYATRLQTYIRRAPYNWFNFYHYWNNESVKNQ